MKTQELRELAVTKWNSDLPKLDKLILESGDQGHEYYMWELVWQEIVMYCALGEQVEFEDFHVIVDRRGFTEAQKSYLKEMLIHIGIGEILSGQTAILDAAEQKAKEAEEEYSKKEVAPNDK